MEHWEARVPAGVYQELPHHLSPAVPVCAGHMLGHQAPSTSQEALPLARERPRTLVGLKTDCLCWGITYLEANLEYALEIFSRPCDHACWLSGRWTSTPQTALLLFHHSFLLASLYFLGTLQMLPPR